MKLLLKVCKFGIFFLTLVQLTNGKNDKANKSKRALLFPASSTLGIFIAIAVPLELPNRNVFMSYNFEANYNLPFKGEHYIPGPLKRFEEFEEGRNKKQKSKKQKALDENLNDTEKKRSVSSSSSNLISRTRIYKILEEKFKVLGYNGSSCLLRLICEVNAADMGENNGFLGDVFKIIFRPTTSKIENLCEDYIKAELDGIQGNCDNYTKSCSKSLLRLVSIPAIAHRLKDNENTR